MKLISLGTGSNGNAFLIDAGHGPLLVDAGIPVRTLQRSIREAGYDSADIRAFLISHEHIDHVRALPSLGRHWDINCITTNGTFHSLSSRLAFSRDPIHTRCLSGVSMQVCGINVTPVSVAHDASEPAGFILETDDTRIGIFTDLGHATSDVRNALSALDIVVIEANYDETLLQEGPYPRRLKDRIRSPRGHLSNIDCGELLADELSASTTEIWLAHLSINNNQPALAVRTVVDALSVDDATLPVRALSRYGTAPLVWESSSIVQRSRQAQLRLF